MKERTLKAFKQDTLSGRGMGLYATKIFDGQSVGLDTVALDFNNEEDALWMIEDVEREEGFIGWIYDENIIETIEEINPLPSNMKGDLEFMITEMNKKLDKEN